MVKPAGSLGLHSHPENTLGPFYVQNGECMGCGAPEAQAPGMMSHDGSGHCFFTRQPITPEETDNAILGVWASCCGAVRYRGQNREVLVRLAELGLADQCDFRLEEEREEVRRNHVSFEFGDVEPLQSFSAVAQVIMEFFALSIARSIPGVGDVSELQMSGDSSSFRYDWGDGSQPSLHSIIFSLNLHNGREWLLRILRNEIASTAFAIFIYKAMRSDSRFRRFRWFTEEDWQRGRMGRPSPY